jgi:hypothetical protein
MGTSPAKGKIHTYGVERGWRFVRRCRRVSQLALAGNTAPPKFSKKELLGLEHYDAMVTAIAKCQEVDEIKDIYDRAKALEYYAAEAKN